MGRILKIEKHLYLSLMFLSFALLSIIYLVRWFIVEGKLSIFSSKMLIGLRTDVEDRSSDCLSNNKENSSYLKMVKLSADRETNKNMLAVGLDRKDVRKESKYGEIHFANINYSNQLHVKKVNAIRFILENTKAITHFLRDKNALIKLKNDKDNLATIVVVGGQVQVTLSSWFFETQSVGNIVGIIAHEFAVHPLASEKLTDSQRETEKINTEAKILKKTGVNNDAIFYDENNNTDHIFAALKGNVRYEIYQQTVYEMAIVMLRNIDRISCINELAVNDLMFSYFSDMATILATNDHKDKAVSRLDKVATYFNSLRNDWLIFLVNKEGGVFLRKLTPMQQRGERTGLLGDFVSSVTFRFKQE